MSSLTRSPLWADRLSITTTCLLRSAGASTRSRYVSKTAAVVAPSTASDGPIPSTLMLASRVAFLTRLRGVPSTEPSLPSWPSHTREKARCPFPSHPRTPASWDPPPRLPSPSGPLLAIRLVPVPPQSFFSAEAHLFEEPP